MGKLGKLIDKATGFFNVGAGGKMIPVEDALPATIDENPFTIFDLGPNDGAIKGTKSEEYWYNPIYGRPRDIDFPTLELLEMSEWVQICTNCVIDAVTGAKWDIIPRRKGEDISIDRLDKIRYFFEELPRPEESFEDCLAMMLPDLLWYDSGVIVKVFPVTCWDEDGTLTIPDEYPVVDLGARDGRTFMIETLPVGGVWKKFWQYSWINPSGIPTKFEIDEILYFRKRPSSRNTYGTSTLEVIQDTVNYLLDSTEATSKFFENGLFVGGQIDHPDIKNSKILIKKAREYKQQLQGPKKMNKWLVTGGGVDVKTFPFNMQEMQWLDGQKWFAKIVMAAFNVTPSEIGFCHSSDTEFLTDKGWKKFEEVTDDDLIGGWNSEENRLVFEKPIKKYHFPFTGKMLRFKGKVVNCCVTPNHRMWVKWYDDFEVMSAEDIVKRKSPFYFQQVIGDWKGKEIEEFVVPEMTITVGVNQSCDKEVEYSEKIVKMDDWLRLVGWVASEGNLYHYKLTIAQNEKKYAQDIRDLISRLPWRFDEYCYDGSNVSWVSCDRQLCSILDGIKENLPRWIFDLSRRQLQILLDTLCDGDGSYWDDKRDHREYYTCEKSLADDVQEIALRCGYRVNVYNRGTDDPKWKDLWVVSMSKSPQSWLEQANVIEEDYDDWVNCFAVPSGFLVTRLDGKISVHHNTEDLNRATGIQQMSIHKSRAIRPILNVIERVLNRGLVWKMDPGVSFKYREQLDLDDQKKQADIDQIYTTIGKVTIAEIRERDGQDPLEDPEGIYDKPFAAQSKQAANNLSQMGSQTSWNIWGEESDDVNAGEDEEETQKRKFRKAMNVAAESGEPGYTTKPDVVDGHVPTKKIEDDAEKKLKRFWESIEDGLVREIDDVK